jgi:hypothetical protein
MSGFLRKLWPSVAALALVVASLLALPLAGALVVIALVCLVSIVRLRRPFWRGAALIAASSLFGLAGIEVGLTLLEPVGQEIGAVRVQTPAHWYPWDPVVQFRPLANTVVQARATWRDELLYDVSYTIDASGARATPGSVDSGPTYLFIGDSYTFSEGVDDADTLASQFARRLDPPAHVVNLGVPGWGVTHMVRAMETGLYDRYVVGKVAAVIAWVTPPNLERATGESSWLGNAPRYDWGADGKLQFTGTFNQYRFIYPLDGLAYLARTHLRVVRRFSYAAEERKQADYYVVLVAKLRDMVQERYGAPLILLSNGPEAEPPDQPDLQYLPAFDGIRALGAPTISVRKLIGPPAGWGPYFIPHDGHPTPLLNRLVADALVSFQPRIDVRPRSRQPAEVTKGSEAAE